MKFSNYRSQFCAYCGEEMEYVSNVHLEGETHRLFECHYECSYAVLVPRDAHSYQLCRAMIAAQIA